MKSSGLQRKMDPLGRVVLPKELRRILDIEDGTPLEFFSDDDKIVLQKYKVNNECIYTGSVSDSNIILAEGKIILSHIGLELLKKEIETIEGKTTISSGVTGTNSPDIIKSLNELSELKIKYHLLLNQIQKIITQHSTD